MNEKLHLFKGFYPFIGVIFLNAFVDLNHKILIADTLYKSIGDSSALASMLALLNALVLVPYILFFTPSGFAADHFSKVKVIRTTAATAIPITIGITFCYYQGQLWTAYMGTLLLSIQSAFNSPAKYGYIKELFGNSQLAKANAIVQPLSIIAILFGTLIPTIAFQIIINKAHLAVMEPEAILKTIAPLGWVMVILSCGETALAQMLPEFPAADPDSTFKLKDYLKAKYTREYIANSYHNPPVIGSIIGLSIFMAVSQVMLATYPAYLKEIIPDISVVFSQLPVALASIGILFGAWYAGKISRGFIETGIIPVAALCYCFGIYYIPLLESKAIIITAFIILGCFCGAFIVPLNALIQFNAGKQDLGKVLATNNLIQNVFMLAALVTTALLPMLGLTLLAVFKILFLITFCASIFAIYHLPLSLIRYLLYFFTSAFLRVSAHGIQNLPATGGTLLLGNHLSYLDWAIVQIASPRPIRFVMAKNLYEKWYFNVFLRFLGIIPIARTASKNAIESVSQALNDGEMVAIFPEGYLSRNGQIGTFLKGFEKSVRNTGAIIIPFYHRGLWGSFLSFATKQYQRTSRIRSRHVSITFGEPMPSTSTAEEVKQAVQALSTPTWEYYVKSLPSIPTLWLSRAKRMGNACAIADSSGMSLSYHELIAAAMLLAKKLKHIAPINTQQNVGIMLPPGIPGTLANLACWINGQTVVNLNYTAGEANISHAIKQSKIKTILSADKFLNKISAKGYLLPNIDDMLVTIESLQSPKDKVKIAKNLFLVKVLPCFMLSTLLIKYSQLDDTAAILFSSGSESAPKGVELTHANLIANSKQIASVFNMEETDAALSTLPLFHAFGLTVTTLMPLLEGLFFVCHPDPTDAVQIGKLITTHQITLLCGTSTLFKLYCKQPKLHPLMLDSVRLVMAGAEKLSPAVSQAFKERFHLPIYEGYGCTEVGPVASVNLPDAIHTSDWHVHVSNKPGSVGLPLPGTAFKIVDPETHVALPIGEAGMVLVGGPQVMKGYLGNPKKTKAVIIKDSMTRWYVTGDKGFLDEDGFLTIIDRYARFAKVAGEMVSLSSVEGEINAILSKSTDKDKPESWDLAACAIPDEKSGEVIVVAYNYPIEPDELKKRLMASSMPKFHIPKTLLEIDAVPVLGSGKIDHSKVKQYVLDQLN